VRAVIASLVLAACSHRVIDLGKQSPDAMVDGPSLTSCVCRVPCGSTAAICSTGACSSDGFCLLSLGTCTSTTPSPCNALFPGSVCTKSAGSTLPCQ
jgi:hypothetical protein